MRWDYAAGHEPLNLGEQVVYLIEVHPAYDHEIKVVQEKLKTRNDWLRARAPVLRAMKAEFFRVSSGETSFTKRATQVRRLAREGLSFRGGVLRIPEEFRARQLR